MKYAILLSVVGALAVVAGCEETTPTGDTSSSSSSSSSGDVTSSSSSSSSGMGGMGTGGAGGGSSSSSGMGGSGGGAKVCDNGMVVDKVDGAMRCTGAGNDEVKDTVMAPPEMVWADKVDGFSSQYAPTGSNSAMQATGAPDAYPDPGDLPGGWASQTTDDQDEFITVGFTTPVVAESVWVFENFNPGAVSKITITAADGDHVVYMNAAPKSIGACGHVLSVSTKTCSPISAVRVDVASKAVSGYNEIDAIGLLKAP